MTPNIKDGFLFVSEPPKTPKMWRSDGRCGSQFPLPNGMPGQCDPNANSYESFRVILSEYGLPIWDRRMG